MCDLPELFTHRLIPQNRHCCVVLWHYTSALLYDILKLYFSHKGVQMALLSACGDICSQYRRKMSPAFIVHRMSFAI